jgi:Plasmid pRiA4b ORF-3-like protein
MEWWRISMAKKKSAKAKSKPKPRLWTRETSQPEPASKKMMKESKSLLSSIVARATGEEEAELSPSEIEMEGVSNIALRLQDLIEDTVELMGVDNAAKFFLAATAEAFGGADILVDSLVAGVAEPTSQVYRLKISIMDSSPKIERVIDVPDCSLGYLHEVIQDTFGWTNSHLHAFDDGREQYGPTFDDDGGMPMEWADECDVLLSELIGESKKKKFTYTYDFGDSWMHEIEFISKQPVEKLPASAVCVSGCAGGLRRRLGLW